MAIQQLGFDFFNEEPLPAKKKGAAKPALAKEPGLPIAVDETVREVIFESVKLSNALPATGENNGVAKKSTRGRMRMADMDATLHLVEVPDDDILFQKRYYGIGEVSNMFKVNVSLIRFWENEFEILKPKKNGKGDRLFRPEDIKNLKLIHLLLREKKYSIAGAKEYLKRNTQIEAYAEVIEGLKKTRGFLLEIKAQL